MSRRPNDVFKSEVLALWYLRLNGVFTIPNFVLHPARRGSARTDADIAGVRYPFRAEFGGPPQLDDEWFEAQPMKPCAILAEVKTGDCAINGPWSSPATGNVEQVLSDLGWYPQDEIPAAALALYESGRYEGTSLLCSLFCVGNSPSAAIHEQYPLVPQRTWSSIINWIFDRFDRHRQLKTDHDQWDAAGRTIWSDFVRSRGSTGLFEETIRRRFMLPPSAV